MPNKLNIDWDSLDIPEGAEFYQPPHTVDGYPRYFRKDFTEIFMPNFFKTWVRTSNEVNYAGSIQIPEQYLTGVNEEKPEVVLLPKNHSHYFRDVSKLDKIDIYMFLHLFNVTDPCLQHIIKKAACAGQRGAKDFDKDVKEISDTAIRLLEMREELK